MVYHQQNSERPGWKRFLAIDPLWFDDQGVIHARATRGTVPFRTCDNTMLLAEAHGAGTTDLKRIEVLGVPLEQARYPFEA